MASTVTTSDARPEQPDGLGPAFEAGTPFRTCVFKGLPARLLASGCTFRPCRLSLELLVGRRDGVFGTDRRSPELPPVTPDIVIAAHSIVAERTARERRLEVPSQGVKDLIAAAYRVLTSRSFRDYAGNPADPESGALQALLDGIAAIEGSGSRSVLQCRACTAASHNGLKHGGGPSLGAVGSACQVPGCGCRGYRPCLEGA